MGERVYRIGQAAKLLGLKPHVLRFWESEFPQLAPVRTEKGQRLYTEEHLALLKTIHHLVHEEGLTLDGARRRMEQDEGLTDLKRSVAEELKSIRRLLEPGAAKGAPGGGCGCGCADGDLFGSAAGNPSDGPAEPED